MKLKCVIPGGLADGSSICMLGGDSVNEAEAFEQKQEAVSDQFWELAKLQADTLGLDDLEVQLALLQICGMPPWQAMQRLIDKGHFENVKDISKLKPGTVAMLRSTAESILNRENVMLFKQWARKAGEDMYALDLQAYDWKFQDSVTELRFVIDTAKDTIRKTNMLNQVTANAILNAIRELNGMYKYSGNSTNIQNAKTVIFVGEDALED